MERGGGGRGGVLVNMTECLATWRLPSNLAVMECTRKKWIDCSVDTTLMMVITLLSDTLISCLSCRGGFRFRYNDACALEKHTESSWEMLSWEEINWLEDSVQVIDVSVIFLYIFFGHSLQYWHICSQNMSRGEGKKYDCVCAKLCLKEKLTVSFHTHLYKLKVLEIFLLNS